MQLTVLFDAPFWVAIIEDEREGYLYAARHVFGAEPSNEEIYQFVLDEIATIIPQMQTGVPIEAVARPARTINPKRAQREIRRALRQDTISTKAQEAIRLQLEQNKLSRREETRQGQDQVRQQQYQQRREKARKKHKGR